MRRQRQPSTLSTDALYKHRSFSAACACCRTHEQGEEQLAQILNEGITTFLCLQAGAHAAACIYLILRFLNHIKPSFSHQGPSSCYRRRKQHTKASDMPE